MTDFVIPAILLSTLNLVGSSVSLWFALYIFNRNHYRVMRRAVAPAIVLSAVYVCVFGYRSLFFDGLSAGGIGGQIGSASAVLTWPLVWIRPMWLLHRATERENAKIEQAQERVVEIEKRAELRTLPRDDQ